MGLEALEVEEEPRAEGVAAPGEAAGGIEAPAAAPAPTAGRLCADPVRCSGCRQLIDPLRAGHVAIFDLRFHFFCNRTACRAAFLGEEVDPADQPPPSESGAQAAARRAQLDAPILPAFAPPADQELPEPPPPEEERELVEPIAQTILSGEPGRLEGHDRDIGSLLLVIAIVAGSLAVVLTLAGETRVVLASRILLASVGFGMLLGRAATTSREGSDPSPVALLVSPLAALAIAGWAALGKNAPLGAEAASLAGILVTSGAIGAWLIDSARRPVSSERAFIGAALTVAGRRVTEEGAAGEAAKGKVFDLRSGEPILVEPGEVAPVDVRVTGGEVEVLPWIGATTPIRRRDGDAVVAGARVVRGRLRGVCTWAGDDRAFARVLLDPRRRADTLAPVAQASRSLVERWAIAAAVIGALSGLIARLRPIEIAMVAAAIHGALATPVAASIASAHVARGILLALRRGIVYRSADAWDRAGRVAVAMFCARGTLLLGEPELTELEAVGSKATPTDVLALAAGAERAEEHPVALAIVRAARARGVRPDGVRNPNRLEGLGVTAVSSAGEPLVVGSRALLLDQRLSIAAAEGRIAELEGLGRAVVLVAAGGRLVGLLGFQDGLRPGARAAVQHLADVQIEPVLLSGDARETCEAVARSLDIEHLRPEVLPAERAAEVRRLIEGGASVAVLGHPGVDDGALGAADVAVALGAAGSSPGDYAVALASDDIRDAAVALALAHRTRLDARVGLALAVVPALVGSTAIAFTLMPPAFAPVASLLGSAIAVAHLRSLLT